MPLPRDLSPMLATAGPLPPDDDAWAYEVKWDGVRVLVAVEDGAVRLTSRAGNDVTGGYPELQALADAVDRPVLLDGEVVAFDEAGRSDFGRLQERMHVRSPRPDLVRAVPVHVVLFDVVADPVPLLDEPYRGRRERLEALALAGPSWQTSPSFARDGAAVFATTLAQGLEGVVAKRQDSRYEPGRRSDCWVKTKHLQRQSAVVVGWKPGEGGRSGRLGSLLLGVQGYAGLVFAGHVGTGFSQAELRRLGDLLAPLQRPTPPLPDVPREHARHAVWVEPVLVAEVELAGWTREGRLRHPSYKGLRDDVDPLEIRRDT
ncbi:MAG: polymerase LigD, ligase domain protein [Frankiales bacterium]|nr:polymerase LigD, ligase domain protein [Frankiales bacterium]